MRQLFLLLILMLSSIVYAEDKPKLDGNWINICIDAYQRTYVTMTGTKSDEATSDELMFYIKGIIDTNQQNNLLGALLIGRIRESKKAKEPAIQAEIDKQIRIAYAFTPLYRIPEKLSYPQTIANIRKYLDDHPDKWHHSAHLIVTNALKQAFMKE